MYSSRNSSASVRHVHGRTLYLYLPMFLLLGTIALFVCFGDRTDAPDGILPQYETSAGDQPVTNQALREEIYREGTSMAGVPVGASKHLYAKRERISDLEREDREQHSWLPRTIWRLKHLLDSYTAQEKDDRGNSKEVARIARLRSVINKDVEQIERDAPALSYQGMGPVVPLRSLRPALSSPLPPAQRRRR